jgi:hypothetical protein
MHRLLIVFLLALLVSCDQRRLSFGRDTTSPGEKLLIDAEGVRIRYDCDNKKRPFIIIEQNEISPLKLYAGEEFRHHFVYVMCPGKRWRIVKGALFRAIYFQGETVFQDESSNFEFKPGKWAVDAFVRIPPNAKPGTYYLKLALSNKISTIERNLYFVVQR